MAQEQVLEHEMLPRANPGQDSRAEQREEFEHAFRITDVRLREVLPPHTTWQPTWRNSSSSRA